MHIGDKVIVIVSFISIHHLKWLHLFYAFKKNRKENLGNGNAFRQSSGTVPSVMGVVVNLAVAVFIDLCSARLCEGSLQCSHALVLYTVGCVALGPRFIFYVKAK